ncbi:MAG: hypothetical protein WKF59_24705 [Chitinophagaceae bacterium]
MQKHYQYENIICNHIICSVGNWRLVDVFKDNTHNEGPKQQQLKVGSHSGEFNQSVEALVTQYLSLKEAFVNADTLKIKEQGKK